MPCAHARTHAHTCMRGAARPARTRETALMHAADRGHTEVVKLLVETRAGDLNAANNDGYVDGGAAGRSAHMRTCGCMCMDGGTCVL